MNFDLDAIIFISFLLVNLVFGLFVSRGVNTIREFAVGDKTFSTATLVATLVSLWVSGEFFFTIVAESYREGLIFMSILIADFLSYLLVGLFFAPRLKEFLGKISIAEAMGELYGNKVRTITALSGVIGVSGIIAIQLQISGLLFEYVLGLQYSYGIIVSGIIITLYSSLGGVKSVTFTDIIQFCTFGIIIPLIAYMLLSNMGDSQVIIDTIATSPKFDYKVAFSFNNPQIYYYISLFLWLLISHFNPAVFQRISMARDTKQVRDSFIISSFIGLIIVALVSWIGILVLAQHPDIGGEDILKHTISNYGWILGFKGLIVAGIMAMIMSTVDSHINSTSILLVHDLNNSLNVKFIKNELYITRICSMLMGIIAVLLALRGGNFFELILWTSTCYMPIVTVPFMMSLFGFRSSGNSVLAGMVCGFVVVVFWEVLFKSPIYNVSGLIPGMLANLLCLFFYHYLFKQPGGWVGIKDRFYLEEQKLIRWRYWNKFIENIYNFNFITYCKSYVSNQDSVYIFFAGFCMVLTYASMFLTPSVGLQNDQILMFSYLSILLISLGFIIALTFFSEVKKKLSLQFCGC